MKLIYEGFIVTIDRSNELLVVGLLYEGYKIVLRALVKNLGLLTSSKIIHNITVRIQEKGYEIFSFNLITSFFCLNIQSLGKSIGMPVRVVVFCFSPKFSRVI